MKRKVRILAMYLPQYHPIPENDNCWGKGFTEWTNVAMAKPLFKGHYQPRIPADLGFYDLRVPEVREAQANLAEEAGIEGFMYWHYWLGNGKRLLERPFNEVLQSGKPDYPFCLGWANHTWSSKTWNARNKGGKRITIAEQTYPGEKDYIDHFYAVLPAFKDHRYITVHGKPFFLIYNVLEVPDLKNFMDIWQDLAKKNGLPGIHFVGNVMGMRNEMRCLDIFNSGVDATAWGNFTKAMQKSSGNYLSFVWKKFWSRIAHISYERYNYKDIIKYVHNEYEKQDNVYPVIYPQMDRTPRAGRDAVMFYNSTPELFEKYLKDTIDIVEQKPDEENRFIIINAWNEWGEGNYIEPDMKYGKGYLEAVRKAISK